VTLMNPISGYYRFTYNSNGTGGNFNFAVDFAMDGVYIGDGSEVGGYAAGDVALEAVANAIGSAIESINSPSWDNITLVSIEAQPNAPVQLYP